MTGPADPSIPAALQAWKIHAGSWLRLAVAIGLVSGLLLVLQSWLLARTVDAVVFGQAALSAVMPWLWGLLALFLLRAVLAWASEQAAFEAAIGVRLALRKILYRHVQRLGPAWLAGERSGDIVTALSDGVEALEAYYARYLPAIALTALVPLAILVFVLPADWIAAVILALTAPLIPLFMILIGKGAEQRNQHQWRQLAWMSAHFLDVIQGLTTLRLFNASRREARMIGRISDDYRRGTMSVLRIAFLSSFALEFFATVSIAIVAVLVGFRLYWGELDFLHGLFVLLLAPEFYLPLRNLGTYYHARMEAIGAAERIVGILNTPAPEQAGQVSAVPDLRQAEIHFEAVSFCYPDGRQGVQELDLVIRPGETLALVGASGAGKSTLVNLLLGFLQPQGGRILVGDTPLQDIALEAWRRQLAWLPQRPQLFPASVADNIRLGVPGADLQEMRTAAAQAGADEFIDALPQGWDTPVGEAGHGLSGGQQQRVALARALLRDAPLVILDEATANLDRASEMRVHGAVRALSARSTLVMIAHRLDTVRDADRIAVLDNGRVVQTGTHAELLQGSALYQRLVHASGDLQ
jgi:ATP-binding cassette, subfamily C, bacterial CydD